MTYRQQIERKRRKRDHVPRPVSPETIERREREEREGRERRYETSRDSFRRMISERTGRPC